MNKFILGLLLVSLNAFATPKIVDADKIRSGDRTHLLTMPAATDTLVGKATTDSLSNKTLVAPVLGAATATSINKMAITTPASGSTLAVADGKTLTCSNTLTFTGTDNSTLNIGSGGTLGTAAYTAASAYEVPLTFSTGLTRTTNTVTVNASQNISTLSNLSSNGYVKTSGGTGALSVQSTPIPVADTTVANHAQSTCSTASTVDWSQSRNFTVLLTNGSACAVTFSNAASGQEITIDFYQPASTGSATVTWSTTTLWAGGSAPTITTGGAKTDSCTIKYNGTDYRGSCVQDMH